MSLWSNQYKVPDRLYVYVITNMKRRLRSMILLYTVNNEKSNKMFTLLENIIIALWVIAYKYYKYFCANFITHNY